MHFRLSYLPPLMVYLAAGVSGLTAIVGTFFVKEYLDLTAEALAAVAFWAGIPWTLKIPVGHLVDLIWRWKSWLVVLGALLITLSIAIMVGLVFEPDMLLARAPATTWFLLAALLAPLGYVLQDVVADAMTVEAVPRIDATGAPLAPAEIKQMHGDMQLLGRLAILGGLVLVSLFNVVMLDGVELLAPAEQRAAYGEVYIIALIIPVVSVLGIMLQALRLNRQKRILARAGVPLEDIDRRLFGRGEAPPVDWKILLGGAAFITVALGSKLLDLPFAEEMVLALSLAIILFLMREILDALDPEARRVLIGTAIIVFAFRAVPLPGPGSGWWQIDLLGFDQPFLATLSLIASGLTLIALFAFRNFMVNSTMVRIIVLLSIAKAVLELPDLAMYYGFHEWTAAHTGGMVDQRFIAMVNTGAESPLSQVAMVPMLAWIANSAPDNLKATFFAVMASFTNVALSAAALGTKYLNQIFTITREVRDPATNAVTVAADYSELGWVFVVVTALTLLLPLASIGLIRVLGLRAA
jgi:hypothetical protein